MMAQPISGSRDSAPRITMTRRCPMAPLRPRSGSAGGIHRRRPLVPPSDLCMAKLGDCVHREELSGHLGTALAQQDHARLPRATGLPAETRTTAQSSDDDDGDAPGYWRSRLFGHNGGTWHGSVNVAAQLALILVRGGTSLS
jgi:hypothetical protein